MNSVFGTILVIVVTGIVVGAVIPMMFHLVLGELERYQMRKMGRACQLIAKTLEVSMKHFGELVDKVIENDNMSNKKKVEEMFSNVEKWTDEAINNKKTDVI